MTYLSRDYSESHVQQNLPDLTHRRFNNALFHGCKLKKVAGTQFINCVMAGTEWEPETIRDLMGVTLTLDCFTYEDAKLSPLTFDAHLYLLSITAGNDAKREKLRQIIDPERLRLFDRAFPRTT